MIIRINGMEWSTIHVASNHNLLRASDGQLHFGCCHFPKRLIAFDDTMDEQMLSYIARHELTHAHIFETQIKDSESYTEEDVCEVLAKFGCEIVVLAELIAKGRGTEEE